MNGDFVIVFDHFKLRVLHAKTLPAKARFAENDQPLTGGNHLLDVVQIEPTADQRLTERVRIRFLERGLEDLFPPAKTSQLRLHHFAAKANRLIAFLARKVRKFRPVLVSLRKVREEIIDCFNTESAKRQNFRARNPLDLTERLREI